MKYLKEYYVPIVVKNKDYLIGFLDANKMISPIVEIDYTVLDSMRFNDILPDGSRRRYLDEEQIIEILNSTDEKNNIVEFSPTMGIREPELDVYLEVTCSCGNYRKFKSAAEIPSKTVYCELCDRDIIDYTHHDDSEIEYDGPKDKMDIGADVDEIFVTEELLAELGLDGYDDDDDDEDEMEEWLD